MDCDPLARPYRLIEFAAFGARLERHRFYFLSQLADARRALLLGEGDGRFLARLLSSNRRVEIDCIDASARMLERAKRRTENSWRVHFYHGDAREWRFEPATYDLVVTNFFLDCFDAAEAGALTRSIAGSCRPGALWLITEFNHPQSGWRARHAAFWLTVMYAFFRLTTSLEATHLPDFGAALEQSGFERTAVMRSFGDLITSELWRRPV